MPPNSFYLIVSESADDVEEKFEKKLRVTTSRRRGLQLVQRGLVENSATYNFRTLQMRGQVTAPNEHYYS